MMAIKLRHEQQERSCEGLGRGWRVVIWAKVIKSVQALRSEGTSYHPGGPHQGGPWGWIAVSSLGAALRGIVRGHVDHVGTGAHCEESGLSSDHSRKPFSGLLSVGVGLTRPVCEWSPSCCARNGRRWGWPMWRWITTQMPMWTHV